VYTGELEVMQSSVRLLAVQMSSVGDAGKRQWHDAKETPDEQSMILQFNITRHANLTRLHVQEWGSSALPRVNFCHLRGATGLNPVPHHGDSRQTSLHLVFLLMRHHT
jgi:hypothetical protein